VMKQLAAFVFAGVALMLAACSPGEVEPNGQITKQILATQNKGLALLVIGNDEGCSQQTLEIAVKDEGKPVKYKPINSVAAEKGKGVIQLELDAGEYFVAGYSCSINDPASANTGSKSLKVGKKTASSSGEEYYEKAFASFKVDIAEVVNLGAIQFKRVDKDKRVAISVTDWPEPDYEAFKEQHPTILSKKITRPMTVLLNSYAATKE
jgi:hypothetical protein